MNQELILPKTEHSDLIASRLEHFHTHAQGAFAKETERALQGDVKRFTTWCAKHNLNPLPATPQTVTKFIDVMAERLKPATVRRYLSSISKLHTIAQVPNPTNSQEVKTAISRMLRSKGSRQKQAAPITRDKLNKLSRTPTRTLRDTQDIAILSTAYDTLCRRSEIAALNLTDITFLNDGTGIVLVCKSKTDQFGEGSARFIAKDTVKQLKKWLTSASITDGAVFRGINNTSKINDRISARGVARAFQRLAEKAGLEEKNISGHSCRVGGCQDMVAAGLDMAGVMQAGGWKTPIMVARYSQNLGTQRGAAAKLAKIQGRH